MKDLKQPVILPALEELFPMQEKIMIRISTGIEKPAAVILMEQFADPDAGGAVRSFIP